MTQVGLKGKGRNTVLVHAGRHPEDHHGIVNPPVYHTSTILFDSVADMARQPGAPGAKKYRYGRLGTPTSDAFEEAVTALEGGAGSVATSCGLSAMTIAISSFVEAGDDLLVTDSVYGPTRTFCDRALSKFGVGVRYYDPRIGAGIADLLRENTRLIFMESPGSHTFEIQDVPAIVGVARDRGITTVIDNTWATPLCFRPFDFGVDVSAHAATKYMVGHSDAMMGVIACRELATCETVRRNAWIWGQHGSPDDLYLATRGLRTLSARLRIQSENGLEVARWLESVEEVDRVLHPALPSHPDHALWRRDFQGASSLFGVLLKDCGQAAVAAFLDGLELFPMGASWGGYESLSMQVDLGKVRTATTPPGPGPVIRFHVGLEDPADLIADLKGGFARLRSA